MTAPIDISNPAAGIGMTLRDYFAAKAMHQFLAGARLPPGFDARDQFDAMAARAYEAADAMIRARSEVAACPPQP